MGNKNPKYLIKRHNTYSVILKVPKAIQEAYGQVQVVRSLGTGDINLANRLKFRVIAELNDEFSRLLLENPIAPPRNSLAYLDLAVKDGLKAVKDGLRYEQDVREEISILLDLYLDSEAKKLGRDEEGHPKFIPRDARALDKVLEPIYSPDKVRISSALGMYLEDMTRRELRHHTVHMMGQRVNSLIEFVGDIDVTEVTAKEANRYVREVLNHNGLAVKTNQDKLVCLSTFWKWLISEGFTIANPFTGQAAKLNKTKRGVAVDKRREATPDELRTILRGILTAKNPKVSALIVLGLYSGMRSNELSEALAAQVYTDHLRIIEGKSESAKRDVPLHTIIKPLFLALAAKAESKGSQWLIQGLTPGGMDNKRNHIIAGSISRYLRLKCGITDRYLVFHSLRKNFTTQLHITGCEATIMKAIVGHSNNDITTGLYSHGYGLAAKLEAVNKVSYGSDVDSLASMAVQHLIDKLG